VEAAGAPAVTASPHRNCRIPGWHITQLAACRAVASSCRTPNFFSTACRATSDAPIHESVALSLVGGGSRRTSRHGLAAQKLSHFQLVYNSCVPPSAVKVEPDAEGPLTPRYRSPSRLARRRSRRRRAGPASRAAAPAKHRSEPAAARESLGLGCRPPLVQISSTHFSSTLSGHRYRCPCNCCPRAPVGLPRPKRRSAGAPSAPLGWRKHSNNWLDRHLLTDAP
jgi:hypothetical protein